jgi:4-amino-4-deoxy-L-arabinose transferase-like glycosyltransferase
MQKPDIINNETNFMTQNTKNSTLRLITIIISTILAAFFFYCQKQPFHTAILVKPYMTLALVVIGIALAFSPLSIIITRIWTAIINIPPRIFMLLIFFISLALYLFVAKEIFHGIPRIDDGVGALFEARILAQSKVTLPLPPSAEFFYTFGVLGAESNLGHWCGMYPPGWPVLLMLGVIIGAPWIIAPILGALLSITIITLGTEIFDTRTGKIAGLLSIFSPFMLVLSGLHLSHVPTGLFCALCLLSLLKMLRTNKWQYGIMAGLTIGMALLCRPLTAAVMGAVFGGLLLFQPKKILRNIPGIIAAAVALSICVGIYLLFQYTITGDPFTAGHTIGMNVLGKYGFVQLSPTRIHTIAIGMSHTILRIQALNNKVLGWLFPSMIIAIIPFLFGRRKIRYLLLLLPTLALLCVYCGFWYFEGYFPARYIFSAVPLLFILCARCLILIGRATRSASHHLQCSYKAFIYINIIFMLAISIPDHFERYNSHFGDVEENLTKTISFYGVTNAIVFMDSLHIERGSHEDLNDYYATGFMLNDLALKNDIIYVRNSREQNYKIVKDFSDRNFYLYRYQRDTHISNLYKATFDNKRFRYSKAIPPAITDKK